MTARDRDRAADDAALETAFLAAVDGHEVQLPPQSGWKRMYSPCVTVRRGMSCALCTGAAHAQNRAKPDWLYAAYGPRWRRHVRRTLERLWVKRLRSTP